MTKKPTDRLGRDRSRGVTTALVTTACLFAIASCSGSSDHGGQAAQVTGLARLNHIVVIVLENWSFDSLYGELPGAEGLAAASGAPPQVDATGAAYPTLPQK